MHAFLIFPHGKNNAVLSETELFLLSAEREQLVGLNWCLCQQSQFFLPHKPPTPLQTKQLPEIPELAGGEQCHPCSHLHRQALLSLICCHNVWKHPSENWYWFHTGCSTNMEPKEDQSCPEPAAQLSQAATGHCSLQPSRHFWTIVQGTD